MRLTATSFAAVLIFALGAARAGAQDSAARKIDVDATVTVGALRPLNGVQANDAQGTAFYRTARVDLVRIPDAAGAGYIDSIFPDMNADVDNPKSYRFAATDQLVKSIRSGDAEPLFCVTRSAAAGGEPPTDLDKWAQIVRHVVLHYNAKWAGGFRHGIRYWEIWNAPDSKQFWGGTALDYYRLYDKTARAIQAADPDAQVGGPAISKPLIVGAYREKFIDFVRLNDLPLDFFSWHFYAVDSDDPYTFVTIARQLRIILDTRGFGSARNVLDQWNADPGDADLSNAARAAFTVSSLIYMLGGPVDAQTYRAAAAAPTFGAGGDAVGAALGAYGALKNSPLLIRSSGGDNSGLAVIAGKSKDNRLVQVLISNYQIAPKFLGGPRDNWDTTLPERRTLQYANNGGYEATITLPSAGKYQVKRYRVGDSSNLALVDQRVENGPSISLQAALPPPGVELIAISAK